MAKFHHRWTLPALLITLAAALLALALGVRHYRQATTLPHGADLSKIGVELTQDQDFVDLRALKARGIDFVYLKSTQGRTYFDENYDFYKSQLSGADLPFGTIMLVSSQSKPADQVAYFFKKTGREHGSLPILLAPAPGQNQAAAETALKNVAALLTKSGQKIMVQTTDTGGYPQGTQFMATSTTVPQRKRYAFWRYTTNGRVHNVTQLQQGVTMFAYLGSSSAFLTNFGQTGGAQ
jgi:lysozyme